MIYLSTDSPNGINDVQHWLDFNAIPWQGRQLWNDNKAWYDIPLDIESSLLVSDISMLRNIIEIPSQIPIRLNDLKNFCAANNRLWFVGTDLALRARHPLMLDLLKTIDAMIPKDSITLFLDATATDRCGLRTLTNIRVVELTRNLFNRGLPRIQSPSPFKQNPRHDFLLTMIQNKDRPHRDILWRSLQSRGKLLSRGLCHTQRGRDPSSWIGRTNHQHSWQDGHASMDLYLDCWLEIVPETCYQDLYFYTEKTHKPIMTHTPFLMVSTAGYLAWLRKQGFRTFDALIDENYDISYRIEDRISSMLDVLEHIIANGTESFYNASQPILDHNFSRLCEIAGSWWYEFDRTMWQALDDQQRYLK